MVRIIIGGNSSNIRLIDYWRRSSVIVCWSTKLRRYKSRFHQFKKCRFGISLLFKSIMDSGQDDPHYVGHNFCPIFINNQNEKGNGGMTSDHCTTFVRSCPLRFFCSCSDFRQVIEYFGYWLNQFIYLNNISMFYISLHAVLPLLRLQIYQTRITFIYTVRFVGDRWDEGEVERS